MNKWLILSMVLTVLALTIVLGVYFGMLDRLPEQVPVHWDIHFQADHFVPRADVLPYLLVYPGLMALFVVLNLALPWLSPRGFKIEPFRSVFDYIMALLVMLFFYMMVVNLWSVMENGATLGRLFVGGIFLFFAFLGNVIGQVRQNFWVGVRTPWTLANEVVWTETHRQAGWLWIVVGVMGFVGVLVGVPLWVCFGGLLAGVLWPVGYSLILYKRLEGKA